MIGTFFLDSGEQKRIEVGDKSRLSLIVAGQGVQESLASYCQWELAATMVLPSDVGCVAVVPYALVP